MSNLGSKYTGSTIFTVCIVFTMVCSRWCSANTIYVGTTWSCYFCLYSILFLIFWVCVFHMLLWLFANMFLIMFYAISKLNWISGCVLYTVVNGNRLCSAWLTSPGGRKRRRPIFAFRYWNIEFYRRGNLFLRGRTRLV